MDRLEHLTDSELVGFYRGELSSSDSRRVVRHLLSGCPTCRERSAGRWQTEVTPVRRDDANRFDEIFDRAARSSLRLADTIENERRAAPELLAELLRHPVERRHLLVANSLRFRSYGLGEALLEAAFQVGFSDPRQAIEHAEIAVLMVDQLSGAVYGERLVNDLHGRAWGTLGNAQRIASRLLDAEQSFQRAFDLADRGTGDPSERARLLSFLASLRTEQHRFDEATNIHHEMLRIYQGLGDTHMRGRTTDLMAYVARLEGDFERSIELSRRAVADLDPERDVHSVLVARRGLAHSLSEVGRLDEASAECKALRREWLELGRDLDALRCDWALGKIRQRQGKLAEAENAFRRVRDRFIKLEIPYDAALANLDLAEALFDQGRTAEMSQRLAEALPLFRSLGIHRETIAALGFLKQAIELEQVSAGLIRATARFVAASSKNPELRFDSAQVSRDS